MTDDSPLFSGDRLVGFERPLRSGTHQMIGGRVFGKTVYLDDEARARLIAEIRIAGYPPEVAAKAVDLAESMARYSNITFAEAARKVSVAAKL